MSRPRLTIALVVAAFAAFVAVALYLNARAGFGWAGVVSALPYLLAGGLTVGAVIVVFVWLAGHSEHRGYDARARSDRP